MAATKYQVMCRYFNTSTNNPITNNSETEYKKTFAFYTTDEAETISNYMIEGNSPKDPRTDMLFAYAGTKIVEPDTKDFYNQLYGTPFMIVDQYERVMFSPWFVNYTTGSLTSALEKAQQLVKAIGMSNVKVIKTVAFDQFIKIH